MSDALTIDAEVIRSSAAALIESGGLVPTLTPLELSDCGSSAVAGAAASYNERAKKFAALLALQLADAGNDATRAADSWDAQEAALAAAAGGTQ